MQYSIFNICHGAMHEFCATEFRTAQVSLPYISSVLHKHNNISYIQNCESCVLIVSLSMEVPCCTGVPLFSKTLPQTVWTKSPLALYTWACQERHSHLTIMTMIMMIIIMMMMRTTMKGSTCKAAAGLISRSGLPTGPLFNNTPDTALHWDTLHSAR